MENSQDYSSVHWKIVRPNTGTRAIGRRLISTNQKTTALTGNNHDRRNFFLVSCFTVPLATD
ncbi:hypothetical protein Thi970DRAFT_01146 [Thiorhodovibrio frisius]|uniref:Uncharacterized protein n=1 Tax=Thiorhodovibrio frisius TaxID=631362 RepID=H8YYE9_9GAMM|nr:hypothetical protein Thi970DRAFT_01146 [Thiorhodovibrio frisius]WPL23438.1 hypothetical protein Thiofri_03623 [Thiorhodovibrio frisius]